MCSLCNITYFLLDIRRFEKQDLRRIFEISRSVGNSVFTRRKNFTRNIEIMERTNRIAMTKETQDQKKQSRSLQLLI